MKSCFIFLTVFPVPPAVAVPVKLKCTRMLQSLSAKGTLHMKLQSQWSSCQGAWKKRKSRVRTKRLSRIHYLLLTDLNTSSSCVRLEGFYINVSGSGASTDRYEAWSSLIT